MDSSDTVTANRLEPRFERRTVDGQELRIAVWTGLPSDKPPLLLFNGIGSRIELLAPFVEHLDPEREIIALDIPGTGESPANGVSAASTPVMRSCGANTSSCKNQTMP